MAEAVDRLIVKLGEVVVPPGQRGGRPVKGYTYWRDDLPSAKGLQKLKPAIGEKHAKALIDVKERWPWIMDRVKSIKFEPVKGARDTAFGEIHGGRSSTGPVEFVISPKAEGPLYKATVDDGYLVGGTVYHEVGHVVEGYINSPRYKAGPIIHEALKKLGPVSRYAEQNEDERFAEAFALWMQGDERAKAFGEVLSEVLDRIETELPKQ